MLYNSKVLFLPQKKRTIISRKRFCVQIVLWNLKNDLPAKGEKRISMKKIWNVATTILVTIIVILAILLVGVRVVGLTPYIVLSGSMEPTYHVGSLIYVKKVDPSTIETQMPITFMMDKDTVATHRVVEVVPDDTDPSVVRFRTKGDANDAVDGALVHYRNVIGTPVFSVPYLGYVSNYITNPPGMYIAFAVLGVIILLMFAPDLLKAADAADKKAEEKNRAASGDEQ